MFFKDIEPFSIMTIRASFPEDFYIPSSDNREKYFDYISRGEEIAKNIHVLLIHLVRDCVDTIEINIQRLKKLGKYFGSSEIHVFEGDSSDGTKEKLKEYHDIELHNVDLGLPKCGQDTGLNRRQIMATLRNRYILLIRKKIWFDHVIIYDDVLGGFSYHGVMNSLGWMNELGADVMGSNSIIYTEDKERLYFDSFAFNHLGESLGPDYTKEEQEKLNRMRFERGERPIEVASCFGGLAIYKRRVLVDNCYSDEHCDHQTINRKIRDGGGKIYLNPSQITLYSPHYYCGEINENN